MKKIILSILALSMATSFAFSMTVSPTSMTSEQFVSGSGDYGSSTGQFIFSNYTALDPDYIYVWSSADGYQTQIFTNGASNAEVFTNFGIVGTTLNEADYTDFTVGTYKAVLIRTSDIASDPFQCGDDYQKCADGSPTAETVTFYITSGNTTSGFGALISSATSSFTSVVGFSPADSVTWQVDNLLKPLIGGGVGLLYSLRNVLITILIILGILLVGRSAMRFFKHAEHRTIKRVKHKTK